MLLRAPGTNDVLGVEMRASGSLMEVFARRPDLVHTALTRLPAAWRRLDAYIAGRTSVAGIVTTPLARTAVALGARLPRQQHAGERLPG